VVAGIAFARTPSSTGIDHSGFERALICSSGGISAFIKTYPIGATAARGRSGVAGWFL
jgi:hypothetical protein